MNLTLSQLDAIAHRDGHLQLIACAGSGKTEVVARRVAQLLAPPTDGFPALAPRNIIAFTFTDKAAGELKERITARVHDALGDVAGLAEMFVGTIHGFCLDLLRNEVPAFIGREVLDEVGQRMLVERHPARSGRVRTTTLDGADLVAWKDTGVFLAALDVLRQADVDHDRLDGVSAVEGLQAWRTLLEDRGLLDYTSILEHAVRVLREDEDLRARLRERVRHVIVDEYQDVNPIQERVVHALAELGAWLCVVGDDDQSIYQWNGANVVNILRFADRYPKVRTLRLQENFRSSGGIVSLARAFIDQNLERLIKAMVATDAQPDVAGDVVARAFSHPDEEAAWIADRFESLHGAEFLDGGKARGLAWSDMAVLIRSDLRRNASPLVEVFKARGIPHLVSGLNNLFETREARAAASLFRYVADTGEERDVLRAAWTAATPKVSTSALDAALGYADAVREEVALSGEESPHELLPQRVFLGFLAALGVQASSVPGEAGKGEAMLANLGMFSRLLRDFERVHHHTAVAPKYGLLVAFLDNAARDQYAEGILDGGLANPDAVRVLTIHKAKGLQWPVIAIPGLVENRFPSKFFQQDSKKKKRKDWWDLVPIEAVVEGQRYRGDISDERRLFYVALTRAQRWLLLSYSPSPEFTFWRTPSSFFRWSKARPEVAAIESQPAARLDATARLGVANACLDFTTIKNLFECPQRFRFQNLYGFAPAPEPAQGFGAALHDALAEIHRRALVGDGCTANDVPTLLDAHLRLPFATPDVYQQRRATAERILTRYIEKHADTIAAVEFVEQAIELPMGNGITVSGRIDLVVHRADGLTKLVDFKSSSHAQSELQSQEQLHLYALGYRALTGRDAAAVEVWDLDHDQRVAQPVNDTLLEGIRRIALEAATMLREGNFPPAPERDRCGRCAMRGLCQAGQQAYTDPTDREVLAEVGVAEVRS